METTSTYVPEDFSPEEVRILERYFTNVDRPVFALRNMPEVVKAALFARYSRTSLSLRRLFLKEFAADLEGQAVPAEQDSTRAKDLMERVLGEYGDDSVAQLGAAHVACEQASNLLTKQLEWGRLASYLEQSTRYIDFSSRLPSGEYRYTRDHSIMNSPLGDLYVKVMDDTFDTYSQLLDRAVDYVRQIHPHDSSESPEAWKRATRAMALDSVRGLLPAATVSNLGIFGSGQALEALVIRLRAHPLEEARRYGNMIVQELRKVMPSFMERADHPAKGGLWSEYLHDNRLSSAQAVLEILQPEQPADAVMENTVRLLDWDPGAELKVAAWIALPHVSMPFDQVLGQLSQVPESEIDHLFQAYVGERTNRRHRPGRAFEAAHYQFELWSDYGAFRDIQRHRILTIDWEPLSPAYGYSVPELIQDAGLAAEYARVLDDQGRLYRQLQEAGFGPAASYVIGMAYRVHYMLELNAREAMHLCELRSQPQGHPSYRRVAQDMHRLIQDQAGHRRIARAMKYVDYGEYGPGRMQAERRAAERRKRLAEGGES